MTIYDVIMERKNEMKDGERNVLGEIVKADIYYDEFPSKINVYSRFIKVDRYRLNELLNGTGIYIQSIIPRTGYLEILMEDYRM